MKTNVLLILLALIAIPVLLTSVYTPPQQENQEYLIVGWNDLGMHCSNKDFDSIVILPPYNNLRAQVILRGDANQNPQIINSGLTVTYEIPGNTYSVGKTNFWEYEDQLFGVNLPNNVGLTGVGLTGEMESVADHFTVDGIPLTPFIDADLNNEDAYQLALLKLLDANEMELASTQPVIPVSNEIGCVSSGCHSSQQDILEEHDDEDGFDPSDLPILCANCHADVALGKPGRPGLESLSEVIHDKHKDKTNDCYKCHPGQNTQCFRGVMHDKGMSCQNCHGNMEEVANSIKNGRRPWLDEPSCGATNCHGSQYAEEPGKLFKDSKGHGGLYCSACHGSPHAILPSTNPRDNVQNIALQGYAGTLNNCTTCHGFIPDDPGPHGITSGSSDDATLSDLRIDGSSIEGFNPGVLNYTYEVIEGSPVPVTEATPNNPNASVNIVSATGIPGTTEIKVTAEDNITTATYFVDFIYGTTPTVHFVESFETGVPSDYFTGKLYLESGTWYGKNVKEDEDGYSGSGIKLKKETKSFVRTPSVNSIGSVSFYYSGDEDNTDKFKVQTKEAGGKWLTVDVVTYNDDSWQLYTEEINSDSENIKLRIIKNKKAKSNLIIDEMTLTSFGGSDMASSPNETEYLNSTLKSVEIDNESEFNVLAYSYQQNIRVEIESDEYYEGSIIVYDLSGRKIQVRKLSNQDSMVINGLMSNQIYIVHIMMNGENYTQKVLVK